MPAPIPKPIKDQLFNFQICFWFWNAVHYLLGLFAALGAALIAADKELVKKELFTVGLPITLGVAVALATTALTFLKASAKANAYIQAWRILHNEVICFQLAENEQKLCDAHHKAEEVIGKTD